MALDSGALAAEQERLAGLRPPAWHLPEGPLAVAAAVVVSAGPAPDPTGAPSWAAGVLLRGPRVLAARVVAGAAGAPYLPALLAARDLPLLAAAVEALEERPDVLLVAAAGRDHPRRAGLALHLGAVLDLPTVGVTDRPLVAAGEPPGPLRGDTAPLLLGGVEVARWVRTATGVRPVVASAAWRTDPAAAAAVVLGTTAGARTPLPLREARRLARRARSEATADTPGPPASTGRMSPTP